MRRFPGKSPGSGADWQVSWDVVCRPTCQGGLRVLNLLTMNLILLSKWVAKIVSPAE